MPAAESLKAMQECVTSPWFKVPRSDADVLVISNKYLDEIRSLPETTANPFQAHIDIRLPACSQFSSHRSLLIRRGIRTSEANTRLLTFS